MTNVTPFKPQFAVVSEDTDLSEYQREALRALEEARKMVLSGRSHTLMLGQVLYERDPEDDLIPNRSFSHAIVGGLADAITLSTILSNHAMNRWHFEAESLSLEEMMAPLVEEEEPDA